MEKRHGSTTERRCGDATLSSHRSAREGMADDELIRMAAALQEMA